MYEYWFRKYKLDKPAKTRFEARRDWALQVEHGSADDWLVDEFPVEDKRPNRWLRTLIRQLKG